MPRFLLGFGLFLLWPKPEVEYLLLIVVLLSEWRIYMFGFLGFWRKLDEFINIFLFRLI